MLLLYITFILFTRKIIIKISTENNIFTIKHSLTGNNTSIVLFYIIWYNVPSREFSILEKLSTSRRPQHGRLPFGSRKEMFMSKNDIEKRLSAAMDRYIKFYLEMETREEFKDLARSASGSGFQFQQHYSVREAMVKRAQEANKLLKRGIYDKATEVQPEMVANLRSAMSAAMEYLGTVYLEEGNEIRKMVITLKDHYLPET